MIRALAVALLLAGPARAGEVLVAVAANFADALDAMAAPFAAETGHDLRASVGGTGALYAQIVHGAPFAVLLAADSERPARLEAAGIGVAGTRFAYAAGRLALWSAEPGRVAGEEALDAPFRRLALADPEVAPYGAAARQALARLGRWEAVKDRVATARNIGQAFAMTASRAAELGFVAYAQARGAGGSLWLLPQALHDPITQEAILLRPGADNPAAHAFLDWLRGPTARALITESGYEAPE